jgi:hypothetical protein
MRYALQLESHAVEGVDISWYHDDAYIGSDPVQILEYSGSAPFDVSQVLEDGEGCRDSITMHIAPSLSPLPEVDGQMLCHGSFADIQPENGQIFYFYSDQSMNDLLYKGKQYRYGPLNNSTTLYVTGMDDLAESDPVAVALDVSTLRADFRVLPDTLNLQYGSTAVLENTSVGASWFYWNFSSGIIDPSPVLYESFESTGSYSYQLIAGDGYHCTDTISKQVVVLNITGLDDLINRQINVFPNPAASMVNIQLEAGDLNEIHLRLCNVQGKEIFNGWHPVDRQGLAVLDVGAYTKGIYIFQISAKDLVYFGRFVKN